MEDGPKVETRVPDPRLDVGGMDPEEELEFVDLKVREAAVDEERTCFCPVEHPKPPHAREEAVTDRMGVEEVDVQRDTPTVDVDFDLSLDELSDVDVV